MKCLGVGRGVPHLVIQKASCSGRKSGSQCSTSMILWSIMKSCDGQAKINGDIADRNAF